MPQIQERKHIQSLGWDTKASFVWKAVQANTVISEY